MTTNDTRTARERAEELAALAHPGVQYRRPIFIDGYLACHADMRARDAEPTTVTAEVHEEAAFQLANIDGYDYGGLHAEDREWYLHAVKRVFEIADIRIEGDPDD